MKRGQLLDEVSARLGTRRLVWAGIRGEDIEPLADLPQLVGSFSIAGAYQHRSSITSLSYEQLTGVRVDPEIWDIDDHLTDAPTAEFRAALLAALNTESALLPYRPSGFLSAIHFARQQRCLNLGIFGGLQAALEHKPWVESAVASMGIPRIPWTYVADEDQLRARDITAHGEFVLRRSRTSGGEGFTRVGSAEEIPAHWPRAAESFVSVAPFLDGLPLNVGATVWADGVTVHHPSVQLVGVASCVSREFGYCGNDFGLARDLDESVILQVESATQRIGAWLRQHGYLGSFGVDFLLHEGTPLFTEVNPRFQGSTQASCRLDIEADESCLLLEHVAAWLGIPCPPQRPLPEIVAAIPDLTNLVVHWTGQETASLDARALVEAVRRIEPRVRADVLTPSGVQNEHGSVVARLALPRRVTGTGFELDDDLETAIRAWQSSASSARSA